MSTTVAYVNLNLLSSTLINVIKPTIKEYYTSKNKPLMEEMQGNCCAETAVIVANIMESSISKLGYIIKAYYGNFIDIHEGNQIEYKHCWVYCENIHDNNQSLFIDIGQTIKQPLVIRRKTNSYDKKIVGYESQFIVDKQEIDHKASLKEIESSTGERFEVAYKEIVKRVYNQKLFK